MAKHIIGLLHIDFMASLYHASVNFYHFFFDKSHVADCHVVQHMLSICIYCCIDLAWIIKIKFIHSFTDKIQECGVVSANSYRKVFIKFEEINQFFYYLLLFQEVYIVLSHIHNIEVLKELWAQGFLHQI